MLELFEANIWRTKNQNPSGDQNLGHQRKPKSGAPIYFIGTLFYFSKIILSLFLDVVLAYLL